MSKALRKEFAKLGRAGGKARAEKLTPDQRQAISRSAAKARWAKVDALKQAV